VSSKRQQTMAKLTRERLVKERRALKLEKKQAAAAERHARADDAPISGQPVESADAAPEAQPPA
jgi:hypothetical protein